MVCETHFSSTHLSSETEYASERGFPAPKPNHVSAPNVLHLFLQIHMTVEHSNESKRYRCTCCGRDYDDITTWRAHMLNAHMDLIVGETRSPKDLQCPYCSKTFQADTELTVHILTHQKVIDKDTRVI